ncbi:MAG: tRNA pseudouridine(38-40) synthase TruA [Clostridia bacterium]|nr:tRNA pseudouridine(38-40) synthase TruA [Clostridia bacterium]
MKTVQGEIEKALTKLLNEKIKIVASGRTDAGVSATHQVAHFDTNSTIVPTNICFAANKLLPKDIQIFSSKKVSEKFNARFSAKEKTYEYKVYVSKHIIPVYERDMLKVDEELDIYEMKRAANLLIGKHDFTSFSTKDNEVKNHVRIIKNIEINKNDNVFTFILTANAFLYNMVRIIIGTLLDVGKRKIDSKKIMEILNSKKRSLAGVLVPAYPLILTDVKY